VQKINQKTKTPLNNLEMTNESKKKTILPLKRFSGEGFFKDKIVNSLLQSTINKGIYTMIFLHVFAFHFNINFVEHV
jgi:hypothetical protein